MTCKRYDLTIAVAYVQALVCFRTLSLLTLYLPHIGHTVGAIPFVYTYIVAATGQELYVFIVLFPYVLLYFSLSTGSC